MLLARPNEDFNRKMKIYTIDASIYCAQNDSNTMIIAPRRHQHPSGGANTPSDVAFTVNFNADLNQMPVNPIIQCFSRDLIPEYCQGLESSAFNSAPLFLSNPSMVTQIGVYLACLGICMQRKLFLPSSRRTSILDYAFQKPSL